MAAFTSTQNGNWNDGATWGLTSPGVKGTDWPGLAGDTAAIGHTVTYNVSETNEMGAITINSGGILSFSVAMSTKLTMSHNDITVNNGGELRVGASGAVIPAAYLAELIWNTTSDNAKGIALAAGGKLTVYGDPAYFGSDYDAVLAAQSPAIPTAGNAVTITIAGDFTAKWIAGQELLVHKGGAYASNTNDFCRLAITSVALNGANTDVACTVTERPAALTCLVGADVLNLSRNVRFSKLGYNDNLSQININRPRTTNANAATTNNISVNDAVFGGFYHVAVGHKFNFNGVIRNGFYSFSATLSTFTGIVMSVMAGYVYQSTLNGYWVNNGAPIVALDCIIDMNVFGNTIGLRGYGNIVNSYFYANGYSIDVPQRDIITGSVGYNADGIAMANTYDFAFGYSSTASFFDSVLVNLKVPSSPVFANRNVLNMPGRYNFEHYQQVANAHYIADAYGDIYQVAADGSGDNPSQRSGGHAEVIEAIPQSNCSAVSYLTLLNIRLWAAAASAKTYRFYVQADFATLPTAELKLYAEYLDELTGGRLATASSTQDIATRANAADWSQYVEVTIPANYPKQAGYVNLCLKLMGYEATKKVWVDPKAVITGTDTVTPYWSYGEVQLDIDPAAGGSGQGARMQQIGIGVH